MSHRRDPIDVLHSAVLGSALGIAGVAKVIGRSPQVLYNKFSDSMPQSEVTAREALAMADAIGTTAYAEAVADHFGGVFMPVPECDAADDDVLQAYLDIIRQMGELSKEFTEARADGVIDAEEFNAMRLRAHRTVSSIMRMLAELEGMVRDVQPASGHAIKKVVG